MYLKNKTKILTIRISKKQYEHLEQLENMTKMNKSDLIRNFINQSIGAKISNDSKTNINN